MKNVVIDLGNMNIKYLGDEKGLFSSKVSTAFDPVGDMKERIELDGKVTYIGTGTLSREFNKTKKDYVPQLLYAIRKATQDVNVNLCVLLPIDQMPLKQAYIDNLKYKTFKPTINGITTNISINQVAVLPEGVTSAFSTNDYKSDDILIIDIGSRTTNYATIINGKVDKTFTEKLGAFDFLQSVLRVENSKGNDYVLEEIERLIERKRVIISDDMYKGFLLDVLNRTKGVVNTKSFTTIFTGGGAKLLEAYIKSNTPCKVHADAVYSNCVGAMNMINAKWGVK